MLLAGDVIFTEVRDLLAPRPPGAIHAAPSSRAITNNARPRLRTEQITLAGGALALWIVIALLLTPTEAKPAVKDPAEWRNELKETLEEADSDVCCTLEAPAARLRLPSHLRHLSSRASDVASVRETSEICADLSALADPGALEGALARVSTLLDATA